MPELPEAECIARALDRVLPGRRITKVELFSPAMRTPLAPIAAAGLPGHRFTAVRRRGRYVTAALDDGRGILMHFGMSGVVRVEPETAPKRKHEHLFIHLDNGMVFRFECPRRFSLCEVHPLDAAGFPPSLDRLGVEPLSVEFTGGFLYAASRGRKGCVKNFIMDNTVVVGVGNIYSAESLFEARIDPRRAAGSLSRRECDRLVAAIREILARAIAAGGTTVSDFLNVDGSEGRFARELRVYGREGEPCPRCGAAILRCVLGGRSAFFCPVCCRRGKKTSDAVVSAQRDARVRESRSAKRCVPGDRQRIKSGKPKPTVGEKA